MSESKYFNLARNEEKAGNISAALLFYLSDFCSYFNAPFDTLPTGTVNKIQRLQKRLSLSDAKLLSFVKSYGPLSDDTCRELLLYSFHGDLSGIRSTLYNGGVAYGI